MSSHELDNDSVTWQEAPGKIKMINEKKAAGHSDWQLPNIRELESLIDVTKHSPALAVECPLHRIQNGYWSGTTGLYKPRYAAGALHTGWCCRCWIQTAT
ncbi:MAG TPA: DUF1566 domain-containing protein [Desulfobacteraceae bacterium]|nr:MAG: hypothetical protein B1H13_06810 [Desulfobacteraceae bacterium 4484_190.3]HDL08433.1 DUF1566 domain-containing protein [Desulfobacteraceae bacterium]